jgi:ferritin-like metal-binding protein YciE
MKEQPHPIATLHQLLEADACKFTKAEILLQHILPEWIQKANSLQLKIILQRYQEFVQQHTQKLENYFREADISTCSTQNNIMYAYIEEAQEKLLCCSDPLVRDAGLLAAVQAINHYKISTYGTAAAFAKALGMEKQAAIFYELEINEKQIDDRLSQLAEFEINAKARAIHVLQG